MKNDILSTYVVSLASMFTILISFKVLSNILDYNDFLEYLKIIRYLNWFYVLLTLSLGFGIIYHIKNGENKKAIFSSALSIVFIELIVLLLFTTLVSSDYTVFVLFIFGQIIFHILVSYFRSIKNITYANYLTLFMKSIVILLVLTFMYYFDIQDYKTYLFLIGFISLFILFTIIFKYFSISSVSTLKIKELFLFSYTRWIENLLRMSYIVLIIVFLEFSVSIQFAGEFALIFTVLKVIESVTQPVVMTLFSTSKKEKNEKYSLSKSIIKNSFIISIMISIFLYQYSDFILLMLFNENFVYLSKYIFLISFAVFPVLATVLIKGVYEEYFKTSPLIVLNFIMLLSILFLFFIPINLLNITIFVAITYWMRFFIFLIYLRFRNVHY